MTEVKLVLNDLTLRRLKPTGQRFFIKDETVKGLRARVSVDGVATFTFTGRDAASKIAQVTLGRYPEMSLKAAREEALSKRSELKAGIKVNEQKRQLRVAEASEKEVLTLEELVTEYEAKFAPNKQIWRPRGPRSTKAEARMVIERVFLTLMLQDVAKLTAEDFAKATSTYVRVKPIEGKTTANGQVSRARAYLGPVLDWTAGRKSFAKIGASRTPRVAVANLAEVHDPAIDDPTITGERDRILTEAELRVIVPLLTWPAPKIGKLRNAPESEFRPVALRFTLLTASRREEVCAMRWEHLDRENRVWFKPKVKTTKGKQRSQYLPLSEAAMDILRLLPGWDDPNPKGIVFPSSTGTTPLGNWQRFQLAMELATGTSGWHRHDLRRTAASIMHAVKVPASVIAQIIAHTDPLKQAGVGGATGHYIKLTRILANQRDPQEEGLARLAQALDSIVTG